MTASPNSQLPPIDNRLSGLALLYQFSNTMLSTIRLNKLTHLILTALTSPSNGLFERAILFLRNEKSEVLQGMLGVTRHTSDGLLAVGEKDTLGSRWDLSEETVARQRSNDFARFIRMTRIEIDSECPVIRKLIIERSLSHADQTCCHECRSCTFIRQICPGDFAIAPLIARNNTVGIILVDNPDTGQVISADELRFLLLLANQAGMAIENSMLYNRIENANASLSEARERLLHGERLVAIGEMAANLAHELKNPLVTIGGFAARLLRALPDESREHLYAGTIVSEVSRLEKMLSEILAFSRKPTICFSECDLAEILNNCIADCATALEDRGIVTSVSVPDESWRLHGDAYQLKQVFLNLILNACDVMNDGGYLKVSISKTGSNDHFAVVTVSDNGGGIPKEILPRIFSPFFTTKQHGTGLGLAIANRIAINHYGSIEAENHESGARFKVRLPLAKSAD